MEIHKFTIDDKRLVLDVPISTAFEVDNVVFDVLDLWSHASTQEIEDRLGRRYSQLEIREALAELKTLAQEGFFASAPPLSSQILDNGIASVSLHVAHSCNLCCTYCYADHGRYNSSASLMDISVAKRAVDFLIKMSRQRKRILVTFFGGEPLLNFDLIRTTVAYAKKQAKKAGKHVDFSITTNGTLISQEISDFLAAEKFSVWISIDGLETEHNAVRKFANGRGSYQAAIAGAKRLITGKEGRVSVRATITRKNPEAAEIVAHLSQVGFQNVVCMPVSAGGDDLAFDDDAVSVLEGQLKSLMLEVVESMKERRPFACGNFKRPISDLHQAAIHTYACGVGKGLVTVTPNGELYPCHRFASDPRYLLGTLDTGIDPDMRQKFFTADVDNRLVCKSCWARYLCGGGCLNNTLTDGGQIGAPDPMACRLQRHTIELSMYGYASLPAHVLEDAGTMAHMPKEIDC